MKNILIVTCFLLSSLTIFSCDSNSGQEAADGEITAIAGDTVSLPEKKKRLIPEAANAGLMQLELAKLALERGKTDDVKQYAQLMVDVYTTKKQELKDYADSESITLPQSLTDKQQKHLQKLRDTEPGEFDMEYWDATIRAHKDAIDEFNDVLKLKKERKGKKIEANSFELWAVNTLKEKHAQMANAMAYRLDLKNRGA
ncbi:DUF4142 domain-containing protein [Botryobacter ruber]|uniref:DUF4142 domain-containing protein n=1 Tax=Botryobacter ruber TaxID=2171629 RepID=UPI0013E3A7F8|nr:DUF4142 domain-containing protein [Botryobacter ruber]